MIGGIFIGFTYKYKINELPGTYVDLFIVNNFFKYKNYIVLTDILEPPKNSFLISPIIKSIVDHTILDFVPNLLKSDNYKYTYSLQDFIYNITEFINKKITHITLYYSGHGKDNNLILPNNEIISIDLLKKLFKTIEIVFIFDCCSIKIDNPNALYIVSSIGNDTTLSTNDGSVFTRNLFNILKNTNDLSDIKKLKKCTVYDNNLKNIYDWVYKWKNNNSYIIKKYKDIEIIVNLEKNRF